MDVDANRGRHRTLGTPDIHRLYALNVAQTETATFNIVLGAPWQLCPAADVWRRAAESGFSLPVSSPGEVMFQAPTQPFVRSKVAKVLAREARSLGHFCQTPGAQMGRGAKLRKLLSPV